MQSLFLTESKCSNAGHPKIVLLEYKWKRKTNSYSEDCLPILVILIMTLQLAYISPLHFCFCLFPHNKWQLYYGAKGMTLGSVCVCARMCTRVYILFIFLPSWQHHKGMETPSFSLLQMVEDTKVQKVSYFFKVMSVVRCEAGIQTLIGMTSKEVSPPD